METRYTNEILKFFVENEKYLIKNEIEIIDEIEKYKSIINNSIHEKEYYKYENIINILMTCLYFKSNGFNSKTICVYFKELPDELYAKNSVHSFLYEMKGSMSVRLINLLNNFYGNSDTTKEYIEKLSEYNFKRCRNAGQKSVNELMKLIEIYKQKHSI